MQEQNVKKNHSLKTYEKACFYEGQKAQQTQAKVGLPLSSNLTFPQAEIHVFSYTGHQGLLVSGEMKVRRLDQSIYFTSLKS